MSRSMQILTIRLDEESFPPNETYGTQSQMRISNLKRIGVGTSIWAFILTQRALENNLDANYENCPPDADRARRRTHDGVRVPGLLQARVRRGAEAPRPERARQVRRALRPARVAERRERVRREDFLPPAPRRRDADAPDARRERRGVRASRREQRRQQPGSLRPERAARRGRRQGCRGGPRQSRVQRQHAQDQEVRARHRGGAARRLESRRGREIDRTGDAHDDRARGQGEDGAGTRGEPDGELGHRRREGREEERRRRREADAARVVPGPRRERDLRGVRVRKVREGYIREGDASSAGANSVDGEGEGEGEDRRDAADVGEETRQAAEGVGPRRGETREGRRRRLRRRGERHREFGAGRDSRHHARRREPGTEREVARGLGRRRPDKSDGREVAGEEARAPAEGAARDESAAVRRRRHRGGR
eukprot:30670-Pelagococcus_subviridis.AAC.1